MPARRPILGPVAESPSRSYAFVVPALMRRHVAFISTALAMAYLLTSSLAGLGAVVLCENANGSVCFEPAVARCCSEERTGGEHPAINASGSESVIDCGDCTYVPL